MTQGGVAKFDMPAIKKFRKDEGKDLSGFEKGFMKAYTPYHEGFFGWYGAGGSVHQWNEEYKVGYGFATTSLL